MDRRLRRGLQLTTWSAIAWAAGIVIGDFYVNHHVSQVQAAATTEQILELNASFQSLQQIRGLFETACIAAVLVGLVWIWRGSPARRARGPLAVGIASTTLLLLWSIGTEILMGFEAELPGSVYEWLSRTGYAAMIFSWLGIVFGVARLGRGVVDLRLAAVAGALVLWRYGFPLWARFADERTLYGEVSNLRTAVLSVAIMAAAGLLAILGRRALRDDASEPSHDDWVRAADGLRLAASSIVVRVIMVGSSFVFAFLIPFLWASGALPVLGFIFVVVLMATTAGAAAGMFVASRTPTPEASTMAAASTVCFLLAFIVEAYLLLEVDAAKDIFLLGGAAQLLGVLFLIGYVHRAAGNVSETALERRASGLHAGVLVIVGGTSLLAHAVSIGVMDKMLGIALLFFALIASIVVLLAVTKAAHQLSDRIRDGAAPAVAVAKE